MPTYRIGLSQTVWEHLTLEIEAENQEEAEQLALEQSVEHEWSFTEVADREVVECKEIKDDSAAA